MPPNPAAFLRHLEARIRLQGPLSVAAYMREVLTNPLAGYYMHRDVFGSKGDFVTSPEISQMFGEMVGVWAVSTWHHLGKPSRFSLAELGPGRGTLTMDVLRTTRQFKDFHKALKGIQLVEVSPALTQIQKTLLCRGPSDSVTPDGKPVHWFPHIAELPTEDPDPTILIGHEFLDALPVHQFEYTNEGWSEVMIDLDETAAAAAAADQKSLKLRWVKAKKPTLNTALIKRSVAEPKVGAVYEICPDAIDIGIILADRFAHAPSAALFIDYGGSTAEKNSLRAIKEHKFVDPLVNPGDADLSCDVDFTSLRHPDLALHGPITQSKFLGNMGLFERCQHLLSNAKSQEQADALTAAYYRLAGEEIGQMGVVYKAMAVTSKDISAPPPFC